MPQVTMGLKYVIVMNIKCSVYNELNIIRSSWSIEKYSPSHFPFICPCIFNKVLNDCGNIIPVTFSKTKGGVEGENMSDS